ncbi:hypothetical protein NON20_25085 (plasmid) [Synechocystis sp. B12]|nr:hypothetical protein NON20_25085 [Synechocystis sp. B12]
MERAKIKGYISENLDQISDKFLAEIAQSIHDYHLDQASQEIQALNLAEFTHEQLAQLVGVPVAVIEERSKPRENRQEKVSQHKLPNQK